MRLKIPAHGFSFKYIKEDLPAGLVVFLVALPLCLGIALASGAPLFAGIISGVVGGLVVASISGSALSVSGPAAGLTVIVLNGITQVGGFNNFLLAVVIAGFIQIALGYFKAGLIGYYFPSSVIKGMLAAIGIILIIKQFPIAIGYTSTASSAYHLGTLIIAISAIAILLIWEIPQLKQYLFFKWVPGALIAVLTGILLNTLFKLYQPQWAVPVESLVQLPNVSTDTSFFHLFSFPNFSALANYDIYILGITIAIIASLETLLSTEAADKLDPYKRVTPTNTELVAQGIGNMIAGLLGGLPMTAVIVRTSANINAGGKTKLAAIFHGILLLVSVLFLAPYLNEIPLACLAAVLLVVGYKLANLALFKEMYRLGWEQFMPFFITIVAIQVTDLLKGIAMGMVVAIFYILRTNYRRDYQIHHDSKAEGGAIRISLSEHVTFMNKGSIVKKLAEIPNGTYLTIDASQSHYIDLDVLEILHDFKAQAGLKNISVEFIQVPERNAISAH